MVSGPDHRPYCKLAPSIVLRSPSENRAPPMKAILQIMLLAHAAALFLNACSPGPPPTKDSVPMYERRYNMLHPTQP